MADDGNPVYIFICGIQWRRACGCSYWWWRLWRAGPVRRRRRGLTPTQEVDGGEGKRGRSRHSTARVRAEGVRGRDGGRFSSGETQQVGAASVERNKVNVSSPATFLQKKMLPDLLSILCDCFKSSGCRYNPAFQWEQWQPWVCMCDIGKQGRVRYFVVSSETAKRNVDLEEFWQVKPCALVDCEFCHTTECPSPEVGETVASSRLGHRPPRPAAGSMRIPAAKPVQADSYDSLPVIDDVG
ncbi:uncharacterized protein LOC125466535 [Stegostoma tigrinum]|uniref:uncharacterized protein LOC125466535 n=1 Tax=Stegostoma tigrinum TaxID=3053191 RepID=UPI00202B9E31|nr:uncharacterized protein LOC125466535 [Stegostoma tigrinum]